MAKSRFVVFIEGKVQKAGFRSFIKKHALALAITGYAENLPSGEVIVIAEGEGKNLKELLELIEKEAPVYVQVERITKRKEKYQGSFTDFERKGTDVLEGIEEKSTKNILLSMVSIMKSTDSKLEVGVERLGEISAKQDEHIGLTKEILNKQDEILHKQDEHIHITERGFENVVSELKGFKELHEEIMELREEVNELKSAVSRIEKKVEA